ncbi:putative alpha-galactosidase B [Byssothecium circinans]|uniref:Alpha-galactosidase n=1 Tax=Byssothecium circinans TaxID=147558 RepID=A0A6A5TKL0_9PLEO|nr:putative alpha-galactosidase B [Byssothecium circinans]
MQLTIILPVFASLITGVPSLVLKDNVGRLPALGWNSWNKFACSISEEQFLVAAEQFVKLGLKDVGYQYVNIDDCWQIKDRRDNATNRLIPDPQRFPDGINGTAKKIHDMGLKIGIYSSAGTHTCQNYQASLGLEETDAQTWAEWGIDYLKYDNCNVPSEWQDECNFCVPEGPPFNIGNNNGTCIVGQNFNNPCPAGYDYSKSKSAKRYAAMRDALAKQNRTILYSLCQWGTANVDSWGNETASSWRVTNDIDPSWRRVLDIWNQYTFRLHSTDFWGHGDMDMLEVGNGLSLPESRSHFAFWAAMKSPLLIGCDLSQASAAEVEVMKNKYLLAFNQDPVVGAPAMPYRWGTNPDWTFNASFPAEYWSGKSSNGTLLLLFNPYSDTKQKTASFSEVPELGGGSYEVTDVWTGENKGCVHEKIDAWIEGHDTAAYVIGKRCGWASANKDGKQQPAVLEEGYKRWLA